MKIIIAPDSFKGSLKSTEVIACVRKAGLSHFPDAQIIEVPIADGGDGTVAALTSATGGRLFEATAQDPLGRRINCVFGEAHGTAVIGMSEVSGLALLQDDERDPLKTSSYGTGELIRTALDAGFAQILVGIGGSATNDGGTGAMQALGLRFLRGDGSEIERMCGAELGSIAHIDDSALDKRLKATRITVMCDVTNPLTGSEGATYVYGPQKGATPSMCRELENGMQHYAALLDAYAGRAVSAMPGAGAAGGMGAALHAFAGAELVRGIDAVLDTVRFDALIDGANLVVTGEGRVDQQSAYGKVVHGVALRAKAAGVPVVVIAGGIGEGAEAVYPLGVAAMLALPDAPMTLEQCIQNAPELLEKAADRAFRLIKLGQGL